MSDGKKVMGVGENAYWGDDITPFGISCSCHNYMLTFIPLTKNQVSARFKCPSCHSVQVFNITKNAEENSISLSRKFDV